MKEGGGVVVNLFGFDSVYYSVYLLCNIKYEAWNYWGWVGWFSFLFRGAPPPFCLLRVYCPCLLTVRIVGLSIKPQCQCYKRQ